MKINRLYKIDSSGAYGDCEITICVFTEEATLEKIESIIKETDLGKEWIRDKDMYMDDLIKIESKTIFECDGNGKYFCLESFEDGKIYE